MANPLNVYNIYKEIENKPKGLPCRRPVGENYFNPTVTYPVPVYENQPVKRGPVWNRSLFKKRTIYFKNLFKGKIMTKKEKFEIIPMEKAIPYTDVIAEDWNILIKNMENIYESIQTIIPAGVIQAYAGPVGKIPEGWILCDGKVLPVGGYQRLFNAIGYTWGGSGANFRVPDGRSGTLKMVGAGVLNDPDRGGRFGAHGSKSGDNVGSYQRFHVHNHRHPHGHGNDPHNHSTGMRGYSEVRPTNYRGMTMEIYDQTWYTNNSHVNIHHSDAWGADLAGSTRDNNIGVLFIIKT